MPDNISIKNTIYDRLMALNTIPDAYENWTGYRATLTKYILAHTEPGSTAIIIGAGPCNDYDLNALAGHFSSMTLLDMDLPAMQWGIQNQKADDKNIKLIQMDLVGIEEDKLRRFSYEMEELARIGTLDITEPFLNAMKHLYWDRECTYISLRELRFDYVICCGVHSQLLAIFPRIAGVFSKADLLQQGKIDNAVSELNWDFMPKVDRVFASMADKGLIYGLEKSRIGVPGRVEGAVQAMTELEGYDSLAAYDRTTVIWPFCPQNQHAYEMELVCVHRLYRK